MGLGKTLECIGLISVHPHSPQPFPTPAAGVSSPSSPTVSPTSGAAAVPAVSGTGALADAVDRMQPAELRALLGRLARLTTCAAFSFEVANERAAGRFDESRAAAYAQFVASDT